MYTVLVGFILYLCLLQLLPSTDKSECTLCSICKCFS